MLQMSIGIFLFYEIMCNLCELLHFLLQVYLSQMCYKNCI
jgi:hypothetical protein